MRGIKKFRNVESFEESKKFLEKLFKKEGIKTPLFDSKGKTFMNREKACQSLEIVYSAFKLSKNSSVRASIHELMGGAITMNDTECCSNWYCRDFMYYQTVQGERYGSLLISERSHSRTNEEDNWEWELDPIELKVEI